MPVSPETLLAAPLILAAVLAIGGVGKLGESSADGVASLRDLRVPEVLVRGWVARLHPWAEIAVAVGLLALRTPLRWVAAVAALALTATYAALVAAALRRQEAVRCNCFGRSTEVVRRSTLARNLLLLGAGVLAVVDCAVADASPITRIFSGGIDRLAWVGAVAAVGLLAWLIGRGSAGAAARQSVTGPNRAAPLADRAGRGHGHDHGSHDHAGHDHAGHDHAGADADADERDPIPDVELVDAAGIHVRARELVAQRGVVLLFLEPECGACGLLLGQLPAWRSVLHELAIFPVRSLPAGAALDSAQGEPFNIHIPGAHWIEQQAAHACGAEFTPTAVLLGADGLIAGGPEVGGFAVRAFLGEIIQHLAGAA